MFLFPCCYQMWMNAVRGQTSVNITAPTHRAASNVPVLLATDLHLMATPVKVRLLMLILVMQLWGFSACQVIGFLICHMLSVGFEREYNSKIIYVKIEVFDETSWYSTVFWMYCYLFQISSLVFLKICKQGMYSDTVKNEVLYDLSFILIIIMLIKGQRLQSSWHKHSFTQSRSRACIETYISVHWHTFKHIPTYIKTYTHLHTVTHKEKKNHREKTQKGFERRMSRFLANSGSLLQVSGQQEVYGRFIH